MDSASTARLKALRDEIDRIDDAIHDLLMKRTQVVESVRDLKKGETVKIRPAREAEIAYRLVGRHQGPFPKRELVRIWREIIVATLSFEGPFSVAVHVPENVPGYWDLARDQYGSHSPMTAFGSVRGVIEAVRSNEATVGVLPLPYHDEADPWWRHLVTEHPSAPRIIARLPFAGSGNARGGTLDALVVSCVPQEPTGRDNTFLAVDAEAEVGQRRLREVLTGLDLPPVMVGSWHDEQKPEVWLHLAEVEGYVARDDEFLQRLADKIGPHAKRVFTVGGYARPLGADELAVAEG